MPISLNVEPYYDDFDPAKNYHKILFVPSRPIQARELTQIQSILQHQIKQNADYMFKNGAMIIPGTVNLLNNVNFVKLEMLYNGDATDDIIEDFTNKRIVGSTTNVKATIIHIEKSTDTDSPTLYVMYISGGEDQYGNLHKTFAINETLYLEEDHDVVVKIIDYSTYIGKGSLASIDEGVYYMNGYFVQNLKQIIALDKYTTNPSYKVGLDFVENIVTATDDSSLRDNAIDSPNYGSAGADRYQILLTLNKKVLFSDQENENTTSDQFIDLMHVKNGQIQFKINKTEMSEFEKVLAKRTYDESGDYVVDPFKIDIFEYRNNNRGDWTAETVYLAGDVVTASIPSTYFVAQNNGTSGTLGLDEFLIHETQNCGGTVNWNFTSLPNFNKGINFVTPSMTIEQQVTDSEMGIYKITNGTAYIKGYEISNHGYKTVTFNKARDVKYVENTNISSEMGQYFIVDHLGYIPEFNTGVCDLLDSSYNSIGTCIVRNIALHTKSDVDAAQNMYKIYVYDLQFNEDKSLSLIKGLLIESVYTAHIVGEKVKLTGVAKGNTNPVITGMNTIFPIELTAGDTVYFNNESWTVLDVTENLLDIAYDGSVTTWLPIYVERTKIYGTSGVIKQLDHSFIRTVRGSDDLTLNTSYYVNRQFSPLDLVHTLTKSGESFAPVLEGNYLFTDDAGFVYTANQVGAVITLSGATNNILTIDDSGMVGPIIQFLATVKKEGQSAKENQRIKYIGERFFQSLDSVTTLISLETAYSEVQTKLLAVYQASDLKFDFNNPSAFLSASVYDIDVTNNYRIKLNETDYTVSGSILEPINGFIPAGPIRVLYEFYSQVGISDYFSIDSYRGTFYDEMPVYKNSSIGDYLDFRTYIHKQAPEPLNVSYPIALSYSYYLPRRDIIQVDPTGSFRIEEGVSADKPIAPIQNDNNVILAYVDLAPYTVAANTNNIKLKMTDLRRYTMRDIGRIDERLKNAEYYVSLTALEKSTDSMQVKDENGLDRYKNGFIVDQFKDHGVGDIASPDYKVAVDQASLECRPTFYSDAVKLLENATESRIAKGYQITGDLVTLPYTETMLIQQGIATSAEYITPYTHIRTMQGDLNIFPASDTWVDTETIPNVTQTSEGNFQAVQAMAQSTGILGTVWNSWQPTSRTTLATSNTSTTSTTTTAGATTGTWLQNILAVSTTTTTTSQILNGVDQVNWARTGTETTVQERWDEVGRVTNVVDEKWSPWMREKAIVLYCKKMMPETSFSVYIDNNILNEYTVAADTLRYTTKTGTFLNYISSSINHEDTVARQYGSHNYDILERGEVIKGKISNATAVVICEERQYSTSLQSVENVLKVVNIKGTFVANETLVGQSSGATIVLSSVEVGSNIRTNSAGAFYGILMLPNNNNVRINAGIITISLRDNDVVEDATTNADAPYDGHGIIQVKQTTIMTVRNGVIANRAVSGTTSTTENWSRVTSTTSRSTINNCNCNCNCGDPLAQTFKHNDAGGVFVTSMDLYFYDVDQDPSAAIFLQIREVVNGYPGPNIVPFSNVTLMPHEIVASKTQLIPTKFTFQSPVYLKENIEYCFVIGSEFSNTRIWVAKMGEVGLDGQMVVKQPNSGSFFRSQNNSTWDTDQLVDATFNLYKAQFDISKQSVFSMKNANLDTAKLDQNPFKLVSGETTTRIYHRNHGLIEGSSITFSGAISSLSSPTTAELNSTFIVSNVELDTYTITLPNAPTTSGKYGGINVYASCNKRIDTFFLNGNDLVMPNTHIEYFVNSTSEVNGKYTFSQDATAVQIKRNVNLINPQFVLSSENEKKFLNNEKSLIVNAYMYSSNPNVTPIIDFPTFSAYCISNKINNPVPSKNTFDGRTVISIITPDFIDSTIVVYYDSITFTGNIVEMLSDQFENLKVGKYIDILDGSVLIHSGIILKINKNIAAQEVIIKLNTNADSWSFTLPLGTTPIKLIQYDHYVDFISPESTSNLANYVTRIINLSRPSNGLRIMFDYNKPADSFIDIYLKTALQSDYTNIEKLTWIPLSEIIEPSPYKDVQNIDTFIEHTEDIVQMMSIYGYPVQFDQITVKIVFRTNNTSKIPRIKNLRVIALA